MLALHPFTRRFYRLLLVLLLITLVSCQGAGVPPVVTSVSPAADPEPSQQAYAEITFEVQLPAELAEGQNLYIEILDEVTGLALNSSRARMNADGGEFYSLKIPIIIGSVVKYRYFIDNEPIGVEYTAEGEPVRYRLYYVDGPGVVQDIVAAWRSRPNGEVLGRIQGHVANQSNNAPVVNALVTAGGVQTLTSSDGSFVLEGLPPGTHNLVVYSLDGAFRPFQQGAVIAPQSTTPALILLTESRWVNVTFVATPPPDSPTGVPVRLLGNIYQLGNTFADLDGGMNTLASRAPLMQSLPDGRYSLTIRMPVGMDLRYKYTLGDGFWNAERAASGAVNVRQLIIPDEDVTVEDRIETWLTPGMAPISFTVNVPAGTPSTDTVSIQFNPFGWTQPIPMWPIGENRWFYILYNPLNLFGSASYRYCRNEQCGVADSIDSRGPDATGISFSPGKEAQNFEDTVSSWAFQDQPAQPVVISGAQVKPRDSSFMAGVEFMPLYRPSWQPYFPWAFQNTRALGANAVMLTPTWGLTHQNLPVIAPVAGLDAMWPDMTQMIKQAQQNQLSVILHPVLRYPVDPEEWWQGADRDDGWWQTWFARYRTFLMYHADLAAQTGAEALVIGDASILPALPGGTLADGSPANTPAGADEFWKNLITALRSRFSGKLVWMLPYAGSLPSSPEFLSDVDMIYVQLMPPLIDTDQAGLKEIEAAVAGALDSDILALQEQTNLPIILGLQYPSARGALDGCVEQETGCVNLDLFRRPGVEIPGVEVGFEEQVYAYNAALSAVNQRSWIAGFFASGYYPPVELKDLSISTRGKPAADVLWYWYPKLLGREAP